MGDQHVTIIGGGIIGCATAYYLTQFGQHNVTLIEQTDIACHSSGKAGGFLARRWCDETAMKGLARKGFELHLELSTMFPELDYRSVDTYKVVTTTEKTNQSDSKVKWLDGNVKEVELHDTKSDTVKVSPAPLCHKLISEAQSKGAKVVIGKVSKVNINASSVVGVQVGDELLPVDKLVIAMGPWTTEFVQTWFPKSNLPSIPPQSRCHSVVLRPQPVHDMSECIFQYHHTGKDIRDPEIYPLPNGNVYICGEVDTVPLPLSADQIFPNITSCERIISDAAHAASILKPAEVIKMQACYLPDSYDHTPMIGRLGYYDKVYIGSGHTCWGILNGPVTGKCLAELMVFGEAKTCDITRFGTVRFDSIN